MNVKIKEAQSELEFKQHVLQLIDSKKFVYVQYYNDIGAFINSKVVIKNLENNIVSFNDGNHTILSLLKRADDMIAPGEAKHEYSCYC